MQDDNLKVDFAILTYHVKGLILSSLLIGDRLTPKVRNEWKLIYKRLITAAKNYEAELNKNLEVKSVDAVEDMDGIIFEIVHKIMRLEKEEYASYMEHLNSWDDGK